MASIYDPQSQRDARWANHALGAGVPGATIGVYGCFITAAAMILTHYLGRIITPLDVDAACDQLKLYVAGDLWSDGALRVLFNHFGGTGTIAVTRWDYKGIPADLSKLAMGNPDERLLVLDFDHNPNDGIQTHAVRTYGWDGHALIIDDPWYGTRDNFTLHYGTSPTLTIQAIVGYSLPGFVPPWVKPPQPPIPVDPKDAVIAQLNAQITQLKSQAVIRDQDLASAQLKLTTAKSKATDIINL